ncbi:MAG: hypothetical protein ACFFDC_14450 [Promethearchaeota archaeon]
MPLDLTRFHQKIMQYPTMYLLPQEEEALQIILETFDGLFGEPISMLSHTARIHLVQAVVQACINVTQEG